jgi:maleamate amidohydrolase
MASELLAELAQTRQRYRELGIGAQFEPGLKRAVLVIDFQTGLTHGDLASPRTLAALSKTALLLEQARVAGLPIYYTYIAYERDAADAGLWIEKVPNLSQFQAGTELVEIDPRIAPGPDDRVLRKRMASSFFGTPLEDELHAAGIDTLIVMGTSTSGCVRASVVDGVSRGFRMFVVEDAVEDRSEISGQVALFDIESKYGNVIGFEEAATLIQGAV